MLVLVNPHADDGRAAKRWERIRELVEERIGPFDECAEPSADAVRTRISEALESGETRFVAAGGDGTVNLVITTLVELADPRVVDLLMFGAIGLGSSNDFHKPKKPNAEIGGFPCRLDFIRSVRHDIGRTTYVDERGRTRIHHWLINASVGMTATGNWFYNQASGIVGGLKRCSAALGMVGAAAKAVFGTPGLTATIEREDGSRHPVQLRNLGVVKNPHFTGCLKYDSPYEPASGDFFVHLLAGTSLWDTIVTLVRLARGRFSGRRSASSWRARRLAVEATTPFAVEGDGEIIVTKRAVFSLEPHALWVCA